MRVYLARFELNKKYAYKHGYTKWPQAIKRFTHDEYADQYKKFDDIIILDTIQIDNPSYTLAQAHCKKVEKILQIMYPKNFRLESYFLVEDKTFNNLSGITEMFILEDGQTEQQLIKHFKNVKNNVRKIIEEL